MIYDYLFYKSYQLGKWSRNFEDMPVLAGVIWVGSCLMFNLFALEFFLTGIGLESSIDFDEKYKYIVAIIFVVFLIFYYSYNGKYLKIIEKYEEREQLKGKSLHPILVIFIYFAISVALLFISGMYSQRYGIFSQT